MQAADLIHYKSIKQLVEGNGYLNYKLEICK